MHEHPSPALTDSEPSTPNLLDGMDEEERRITVGLGLVAREAAAAEYVLHGIYVHLASVAKAYTQFATATGGQLVKQCRKELAKLDEASFSASQRLPLEQALDDVEEGLRLRNRFLHGYWRFDHETQTWLTLKGAHDSTRPEITHADSDDVWKLAIHFRELRDRLVRWDIVHFGECTEDEDGNLGWASVKRI